MLYKIITCIFFLKQNIAKIKLIFKVVLEINDSYLSAMKKQRVYNRKKGDVVNLTEMPHGSFVMMLIF